VTFAVTLVWRVVLSLAAFFERILLVRYTTSNTKDPMFRDAWISSIEDHENFVSYLLNLRRINFNDKSEMPQIPYCDQEEYGLDISRYWEEQRIPPMIDIIKEELVYNKEARIKKGYFVDMVCQLLDNCNIQYLKNNKFFRIIDSCINSSKGRITNSHGVFYVCGLEFKDQDTLKAQLGLEGLKDVTSRGTQEMIIDYLSIEDGKTFGEILVHTNKADSTLRNAIAVLFNKDIIKKTNGKYYLTEF
jgi:hypothetical protein